MWLLKSRQKCVVGEGGREGRLLTQWILDGDPDPLHRLNCGKTYKAKDETCPVFWGI